MIFDLNKMTIEEIEELKFKRKEEQKSGFILAYEQYIGLMNQKRENESAVFISHRSSQKQKAEILSNFFNKNKFDVYLDIKDELLQNIIKMFDGNIDDEIYDLLTYGIKESNHVLCLLSWDVENTPWVRREINMANKSDKDVSGIIIGNTSLPDFFKNEKILKNESELKIHFKIRTLLDNNNISDLYDFFKKV